MFEVMLQLRVRAPVRELHLFGIFARQLAKQCYGRSMLSGAQLRLVVIETYHSSKLLEHNLDFLETSYTLVASTSKGKTVSI